VKEKVSIPVAVKLSPFFSALPNFTSRLADEGADALVLFNRFYQPDIDVAKKDIKQHLSLSRPEDILLPLRWIAILYDQVDCSLALTSGVHSGKGVMKAILAGAAPLKGIIADFEALVEVFGEDSLENLRGSLSLENYVEPAAFERSSYIKLLQGFGRI
jgi:dihydroorotate dehydrogenase (fumarate)